jgi:divalent metal cation (Fe/Co/Zn/Cd) transporter
MIRKPYTPPNSKGLMRWATYASVSVVSAMNLIAARYYLQPADLEHCFGHGKAEALAGLMQSAFI